MSEYLTPEPIIYPTPEGLLRDSESQKSIEGVAEWHMSQEMGTQILTKACSDARVSVRHAIGGDTSIVSVTSIAAAFNLLPFRHAAIHPGVSKVLAVGHMGCGGLAARAHIQNGDSNPDGGVYSYVDRHIKSPDVVVQTVDQAQKLANMSNRPTLAMVLNHETEELFPVAYFTHRGHTTKASFTIEDVEAGNLERIYKDHPLPEFDEEWLPDDMREILEKNRQQVQVNHSNPKFIESQRVQNPHSILVSTSIIPASIRYSSTFGEPNTCFTIRLPMIKTPENGFNIDPDQLKQVIYQSDYPITHSMAGHGPFSQTRRLIIETPNVNYSKMIADAFMGRSEVRDWIETSGAGILVTQLQSAKTELQSGKTVAAEQYV